jgi:uncharacterized membrane protein YebE (DUF533 family)
LRRTRATYYQNKEIKMDVNSLLEQLLQSGKDMAQKGQATAEQQLGIPSEGADRDAVLSGLKSGAAAAGVLALLLGTQAGRRVTGATVKVGSLAALGGLAYQMYRQWDNSKTAPAPTQPAAGSAEAAQLPAPAAPKASVELLLKAMIAAAKADGHVDAAELAKIRTQLASGDLGDKANDMILEELVRPLDAKALAALTNGDQAIAMEVYLVSAAVIDASNEAEQVYLEDLRVALQLPESVKQQPVAPAA